MKKMRIGVRTGRKRKMGRQDRIFMLVVYLLLAMIFVLAAYPVLFVISASVSDPKAVSGGKMLLWPVGFNLDGYEHLAQYRDIWIGYVNSVFYTVLGTGLNLLVTIPAAYALSRKDMKGRNILMGIFVVTMYFGGGLIPVYLNFKWFHLLNTRAIMLLGGVVSVYNMIVCRTFFANTIPWELQEAACLDGASDAQILRKVVLPLSKPILAVMMLYYGEGHWNTYFGAMIYLRDREKFPLQLFLREILVEAKGIADTIMDAEAESIRVLMQQQDLANQLKYAVIIVATIPMLLVYPWVQKYFAQGVMIGSIKG